MYRDGDCGIGAHAVSVSVLDSGVCLELSL